LGFPGYLDPECLDLESLEYDLAFDTSAISPELSRVVEGGITPRATTRAILA
jgi:hypothetical protein